MSQYQSFDHFLADVKNVEDISIKKTLIEEYIASNSIPVIENTNVYFIYYGKGIQVAVPGEMNNWNINNAIMTRIENTQLFYRKETFPLDGRIEYKIWVDGVWMLDPLNPRKATGGLGENSDLWMPLYIPFTDDKFNPEILHGQIDTIWVQSTFLKRTHPVYVYFPAIEKPQRLPLLYVTDGGDYLTFGRMNIILDNLIAEKKIKPIIAIFIDPRTNPDDPSSNQRMTDYSASEDFVDFLEKELHPLIENTYKPSINISDRFIVGTSMGGLIATYIVLRRPDFIRQCAVQSPAYRMADSIVIKLARTIAQQSRRIYIDVGTFSDTENESRLVAELLIKKGEDVYLKIVPEGHNWTSWRARIPVFLKHFLEKLEND